MSTISRRNFFVAAAATTLLTGICNVSQASWPQTPDDRKIVVQGQNLDSCGIVSDGEGGTIAVYNVNGATNGSSDLNIQAQRYDKNGNPLWGEVGISVCSETAEQSNLYVASDGLGGCYVVWNDQRFGDTDVFANRINKDGSVIADNGLSYAISFSTDRLRSAVADGLGGCIFVWDTDNFTEVRAQRITSDGTALWGYGGLVVTQDSDKIFAQNLISDGNGGAYIGSTYGFPAPSLDFDPRISRITPAGVVSSYTLDGDFAPVNSMRLARLSDGRVMCVWVDSRNGQTDIYGRLCLASGVPVWPSARKIVGDSKDDYFPELRASSNGGVLLSWTNEYGPTDNDAHLGRLNSEGVFDWAYTIAGSFDNEYSDEVFENGNGDIFASYATLDQLKVQIFNSAGQVSSYLTAVSSPGIAFFTDNPVSFAEGTQNSAVIFASGYGSFNEKSLVRVRANGSLGGEPVAAPVDFGVSAAKSTQLSIFWKDTASNETAYQVYRRHGMQADILVATLPANSNSFTDTGLLPNTAYLYTIVAVNLDSAESGFILDAPAQTDITRPDLVIDPSDARLVAKKTKGTIYGVLNIRNAGDAASVATEVALYLSPVGNTPGLELIRVPVPALAPGASVQVAPGLLPPKKPGKKQKTIKFKLPKGTIAAGQFLVGFVDWGNPNAGESNENNNFFTSGPI